MLTSTSVHSFVGDNFIGDGDINSGDDGDPGIDNDELQRDRICLSQFISYIVFNCSIMYVF